MKKGTKIRNVFTDEMMSIIRNRELSSTQVGEILRQIVYPGEFEVSDGMAKIFAKSFYLDYLSLTLSCAESKAKELERLRKFYSSPKHKMPEWFPKHYEACSKYYNNIISVLSNVITDSGNIEKHYADITKALDNVPITFAIVYNTNRNTNTNSNDTDRDRDISPKSPEGIGEMPRAISADDLLAGEVTASADETKVAAIRIGERIESTDAFGHMRVNTGKLMKCLCSILKKKLAAGVEPGVVEGEIMNGIQKWTPAWEEDGWRFVPGRITDWLYDGKYLEEPRKKTGGEAVDYGEVGVKEIV